MSFITKRERVFNDYNLFELPSRNEGKLKAYASCTDARAWSHFCSDKTEHLVDVIKRNNEKCRPKYVPTHVIIDTLMVAKNAEIARLKGKIDVFEQMLAAYDDLELTCEQKCEIANAHAAIKAANKQLKELCLSLDLSGFTEGVDSEAFETGKSRGDETGMSRGDEPDRFRRDYEIEKFQSDDGGSMWSEGEQLSRADTKSQTDIVCKCDVTTSAHDPRIEEMQEIIINKDAKLNAMKNTIAVMENDVCEPYCIYAHIYTALEKIFGILCQNERYNQYLSLLTAGRDTRCIDIKGKILYKLKVLEKFSVALVAPCSQEITNTTDCSCYRVETTLSLVSEATEKPSLDNKRAQLVADIMQQDDMKEIVDSENISVNMEEEQIDESVGVDNYNINKETLKRLKELQCDYNELMTCYEDLKHDKSCLQVRCHKYKELEAEMECLRCQLREYNVLWNEKEHYKKRSIDLDDLQKQYYILSEETLNLETKVKAETEINLDKSKTLEQLRNENIELEKKYHEIIVTCEKEKNTLQCKLKESECKTICQEEQIKCLYAQIDRLLEHDNNRSSEGETRNYLLLIDENESLRDKIRNLNDTILCNQEEKQELLQEFQDKLNIINELKMIIEDYKSTYEKARQRNEYLEKYKNDEVEKLQMDIEEKVKAIDNLLNVNNIKSQEIDKLQEDQKNYEVIATELQQLRDEHQQSLNDINILLVEKNNYIQSVESMKRELIMHVNNEGDLSKKVAFLKEETEKLVEYNKSLEKELQEKKYKLNNAESSIELTKKKSIELMKRVKEGENSQHEYLKLNKNFNDLMNKYNAIKEELEQKRDYVSQLHQSLSDAEFENSKQDTKRRIDLESIKNANKELILENNMLHVQINGLNDELKRTADENNGLRNHIKNLELKKVIIEESITNLQNENSKSKINLDLTKKESEELSIKYNEIERDYHHLKEEHRNIILENESLQNEIKLKLEEFEFVKRENNDFSCKNQSLLKDNEDLKTKLNTMEKENYELNNLNRNLLKNIEDLETALIDARKQIMNQLTEGDSYKDMANQVEDMKKEKCLNIIKIRELLDRRDEMENLISDLREDIATRDDKIMILQNHVNHLGHEIKNLHEILANTLNTGEELKNNSYKKIEHSLKNVEAHHSKATHIMKLELEKLQSENVKLSQQLSKNRSESSQSDKYKYISQVIHLQNEREIIISDIRKLELQSVGDSSLSPDNCDAAHILASLDRIRKYLDSRSNTLLQVQESSQLVQAKADEAIKIVEKEKEKIITEKEEAIKDRLKMEKDLNDLNYKLQQQISTDKEMINNLELELQNQKLILNKIKQSSQTYIAKLQDELKCLQNSYENSIVEVNELKAKCKDLSNNNEFSLEKIENVNLILENQSKEILILQEELESLKKKLYDTKLKLNSSYKKADSLQNDLNDLRNKPLTDIGVQTILNKHIDNASGTDEELKNKSNINITITSQEENDNRYPKNTEEINHLDITTFVNKLLQEKHGKLSDLLPKQKPPSVNEVQILATNVEPNFDFIRNVYLNFKLNRLGEGKLEQYSISGIGNDTNTQHSAIYNIESPNIKSNKTEFSTCPSLIDIYNKLNTNTSSSKFNSNEEMNYLHNIKSALVENEYRDKSTNVVKQESISNDVPIVENLNNSDKDLFVIYNDNNENSKVKSITNSKEHLLPNRQPDIVVERVIVEHQHLKPTPVNKKSQESIFKDALSIYQDSEDDYDNVKPKLVTILPNIEMSEIRDNSLSMSSDDRKKSFYFDMPKTSSFDTLTVLEKDTKASISLPTISTEDNQNVHTFVTLVNNSKEDTSISLIRKNEIGIMKKDSLHNYNKGEGIKKIDESNKYIRNRQLSSSFSFENLSDEEILKRIYQEKIKDVNLTNRKMDSALQSVYSVKENSKTTHESLYREENSEEDAKFKSHQTVAQIAGEVYNMKRSTEHTEIDNKNNQKLTPDINNYGLEYILNSVQPELRDIPKNLQTIKSENNFKEIDTSRKTDSRITISMKESKTIINTTEKISNSYIEKNGSKSLVNRGVMAKTEETDVIKNYENQIEHLKRTITNIEVDYKKKIDAIKTQYDINIKNILKKHNEGVKSIQCLHEETLQDIIKIHENEAENLRAMSIDAMRKVEQLENENRSLKLKIHGNTSTISAEKSMKTHDKKKHKHKNRTDTTNFTKTAIEAFNVTPKSRLDGPCTCSVDVNMSDKIRNIFQQVDGDQRKAAEKTYLKYIANKLVSGNVENLDAEELSFLHLKVCRTWKVKLTKEESLKRRIDSLEREVINKQRNAQEHIAELDRKVAEEKRKLQEVCETMCRVEPRSGIQSTAEKDAHCYCNTTTSEFAEILSAGDVTSNSTFALRPKCTRESNRAVMANLENNARHEKKIYNDDPPIRLRRSYDRTSSKSKKN